MIKNERQYRIIKAQAQKFRLALTQLQAAGERGLHPRLRQAEIAEYESLLVE